MILIVLTVHWESATRVDDFARIVNLELYCQLWFCTNASKSPRKIKSESQQSIWGKFAAKFKLCRILILLIRTCAWTHEAHKQLCTVKSYHCYAFHHSKPNEIARSWILFSWSTKCALRFHLAAQSIKYFISRTVVIPAITYARTIQAAYHIKGAPK